MIPLACAVLTVSDTQSVVERVAALVNDEDSPLARTAHAVRGHHRGRGDEPAPSP